jgi:hypothetical protein
VHHFFFLSFFFFLLSSSWKSHLFDVDVGIDEDVVDVEADCVKICPTSNSKEIQLSKKQKLDKMALRGEPTVGKES